MSQPDQGNRHIQTLNEAIPPYNSEPPTSGPHLPYIAPWGIHPEPIPRQLQVHNLEDGGVMVQYNCPDACPDLVARLTAIVSGYDQRCHPGALSRYEDADRADGLDAARRLRRARREARPPLHHRLPRDRPPPAVECTHDRTARAASRGGGPLLAGGCAAYISPLQPPPYRDQIAAPYDVTWNALIRALAFDNVPLRAVAKDSGVIASDDLVSPIGVYADCGSKGDKPLEGEALVTFTRFRAAERRHDRSPDQQQDAHVPSRQAGHAPADSELGCVSTTRWEPNLVDSVRRLVKE